MLARAPAPAFSLRTRTVGQERKVCFLPSPTCFAFPSLLPPRRRKAALVSKQPGLGWPGDSCCLLHPRELGPARGAQRGHARLGGAHLAGGPGGQVRSPGCWVVEAGGAQWWPLRVAGA